MTQDTHDTTEAPKMKYWWWFRLCSGLIIIILLGAWGWWDTNRTTQNQRQELATSQQLTVTQKQQLATAEQLIVAQKALLGGCQTWSDLSRLPITSKSQPFALTLVADANGYYTSLGCVASHGPLPKPDPRVAKIIAAKSQR